MPRKKKTEDIEQETDNKGQSDEQGALNEEEDDTANTKKQKAKSKDKNAPWPSKKHGVSNQETPPPDKPSLINFIIGALFLALIAYGFIYANSRYDLFSFVRPSTETPTENNEDNMDIDNKLANLPGDERECLEAEIGEGATAELQQNQRIPTENEQLAIDTCVTFTPNESEPEKKVGPNDLPLADELAIATGTYKWCVENGLGEDIFESLINEEREPSEAERGTIDYCQTHYWDDSKVACVPSDTVALTELGKVITYESAGLSDGFVADSSAVKLADGRIRIYFEGGNLGIMSAISTTPFVAPYESLEFVVEGTVVNPGYSHPRAIVLDDGRVRLFARANNAISSFISDDGFFFNPEDGTRITGDDLGFQNITGVDIVPIDTGYRMYIGNALVSDDVSIEDRPDLIVKSAVSTDMLTWTVEDGVRLGNGSDSEGFQTDDQQKAPEADHPSAVLTHEQNVLASFRSTNSTCVAASEDGLTFERPILISEENILPGSLIGGDTDLVELEPDIYLITATGGGPTPESYISAGVLRITS